MSFWLSLCVPWKIKGSYLHDKQGENIMGERNQGRLSVIVIRASRGRPQWGDLKWIGNITSPRRNPRQGSYGLSPRSILLLEFHRQLFFFFSINCPRFSDIILVWATPNILRLSIRGSKLRIHVLILGMISTWWITQCQQIDIYDAAFQIHQASLRIGYSTLENMFLNNRLLAEGKLSKTNNEFIMFNIDISLII